MIGVIETKNLADLENERSATRRDLERNAAAFEDLLRRRLLKVSVPGPALIDAGLAVVQARVALATIDGQILHASMPAPRLLGGVNDEP